MSAPSTTDGPHVGPPSTPRRPLPYGLITASVLAVVVLAIALVVAFSSDDSSESTSTPSSLEGSTNSLVQPDLTGDAVPDMVLETFEGGSAALRDYAGQPMVVNFFASWCTPCIKEMPDFETVNQELGDQVTFVGVNSTDRLEDGQRIAEQSGVTYDLLADTNGDLLAELGGVGMPVTLLVDEDGVIVETRTGGLDAEELRTLISDELGVS